MPTQDMFVDGVLRKRWDDDTRTVSTFDASGDEVDTRPYTAEEDTAADQRATALTEDGNRSSIEDKALAALESNKDYLATSSPSNAQVVAQVRLLTRQNNGLIRLLLGRFESDDA